MKKPQHLPLSITFRGHTASMRPCITGIVIWDIDPPIGSFAPVDRIMRKDCGNDTDQIKDITDSITRIISAGDGPILKAFSQLADSLCK